MAKSILKSIVRKGSLHKKTCRSKDPFNKKEAETTVNKKLYTL